MKNILPCTVKDLNLGDRFYISTSIYKSAKSVAVYTCQQKVEDGIVARGLIKKAFGSQVDDFFLPDSAKVRAIVY